MLLKTAAAINTMDIKNDQIGEREIPLKGAQHRRFDTHGSDDPMTALQMESGASAAEEALHLWKCGPFTQVWGAARAILHNVVPLVPLIGKAYCYFAAIAC